MWPHKARHKIEGDNNDPTNTTVAENGGGNCLCPAASGRTENGKGVPGGAYSCNQALVSDFGQSPYRPLLQALQHFQASSDRPEGLSLQARGGVMRSDKCMDCRAFSSLGLENGSNDMMRRALSLQKSGP